MRVVIMTPVPFWHPGTGELIGQLKANGIDVIAFDIFNGRIFDDNGIQHDLKPAYLTGFFGKVYLKLFRKTLIAQQIRDEDILDIHFVEPAYSRYLNSFKRKKVKLVATLFGSDLFRTSDAQKGLQAPIFDQANAIVLSENMIPYFRKYFPDYDDKFHHSQYGSSRLDLIAEKILTTDRNRLRQKYGINEDKIVISCGYNAKREQQHLKMLDQIDKFSEVDKKKLFLVLSLTYGSDESGADYIKLILRKLENIGVENLCLTSRLTDDEIAEVRLLSDITLNLQTTDALASSIKEAMVAGDVMLIDEGLPYEIYREMGVFYLTTSSETLTEDLRSVLDNLGELSNRSLANREKILSFASWKVLIADWIKFYNEI